MKRLVKSLDYVKVIKYLFVFLSFLLFNSIELQPFLYSAAPLAATLSHGASPIITSLIFICSFVVLGRPGLLGSAAICAAVLVIINAVHKHYKQPPKFAACAYVFLSLIGFIFLGDTLTQIPFEKRVFTCLITVFLCFFCVLGYGAVVEKGLRFKLGFEEFASISVLTTLLGLGICNLCSPLIWRIVSVAIILTLCYFYRTGIATIASSVLGISFALYYNEISFVALFLVWTITAESLMPLSRYIAAISIITQFKKTTLFVRFASVILIYRIYP